MVVDEVACDRGAEIEARFHSDVPQVPREGYTLLDGPKGGMALIPVAEAPFSFRADRHPYMAVFKESTFKWLPYNGTVLSAPGRQDGARPTSFCRSKGTVRRGRS